MTYNELMALILARYSEARDFVERYSVRLVARELGLEDILPPVEPITPNDQ